jgi:flagellin
MSLGVLNNLNAIYATNNLNNTSSSLSKVLNELSSGSKINSGSDDAAGLSLVNGLAANSAALTQSETNASEGVGLLTVADGALSQVTNLLNRAVTLATEVSNGTLNTSQNTAANQEYQSILSEISNIGSTTDYNGKSVFGSTFDIYTGDSTSSGASVNSLNIRSLSSSNVGDSNGSISYSTGQDNVFIDLSSDGSTASATDSLNSSGSTSMAVTYVTTGTDGSTINATATISVGTGTSYDNTVAGMVSAINGSGLGLSASLGTAEDAGSGATSAALAAGTTNTYGTSSSDTGIIITGTGIGAGTNDAGEIGKLSVTASSDTLSGTLDVVGSDGSTHQVALGTANSTDSLSNLANTINKAGYGVTATVNAAGTSLEFTSASSKASVSGTDLKDAGTPVSLSNTPSSDSSSETLVGDISLGTAATGSLVIGSTTYATTASTTTSTLLTAINKNSATTGISASIDSTTNDLQIFSANSEVKPTITATDGGLTKNDITTGTWDNAGTTSDYYSTKISLAASTNITDASTGGGTANTGIATDVNGSTGIATISYTDSAGTDLSSTDLSSTTDAQSALTDLNAAINNVAAQDGYIGAQINTLNAISSVLSTQQENVVSAQNSVQATDYATATSQMSKYEILSQTGISALAQANSVQQEVTKLLQ